MYMYKEDFENIIQKQRPSPKGFIYFAACNSTSPGPRTTTRNLVTFFKSRSIKKNSKSAANVLPTAEIGFYENLFCRKARLPVAFYLFTRQVNMTM